MSEPAEIDALWGDAGWELCPGCSQRYAYELEVRCLACDSPLCPICVVRVRETRETFFCRGCHEEG